LKAPGKTIDERYPCSCGLVYRHGSSQLRRPVDQGRLIMLLGAIADDFTGASDLANTLVKGGMRTTQFIGTPEANEPVDCAAGIIALKTRSIASEDAIAQSLQALHWLLRQGCRQIIFKYCSTFDSTPSGNIGPVAEALGDAMGVPAAIVCPAFPATGRFISAISLSMIAC
jgi:3-dehydrotetronate 4-kinase